MLAARVTVTFLYNCLEMLGKAFFGNILKLLSENKKNSFSAELGTFTLSTEKITSKSIILRWNRTQRLNSKWQDRKIFVQIESKLGLRNRSFPSVPGMGNFKLFTDLSPYIEYKFTLREVAGNFIGNSTSISFNTSEDGKRYIHFSNLVQ